MMSRMASEKRAVVGVAPAMSSSVLGGVVMTVSRKGVAMIVHQANGSKWHN